MKHIIKPGMEIDVPSLGEIEGKFSGLFAKHFGPFHTEYPRVMQQVNADATGNLNLNTAIGPKAGFAWDVKRLTIVNPVGNSGNVAIYINSGDPSGVVVPALTALPFYVTWSSQQFVMRPNEELWLVGTGLGANSQITITGQVKEVPVNMMGRLNL